MFHCPGLYALTTQLELAVIAFFQSIVQICRRLHLAIVFDFFIAFDFNDRTILEGESVGRGYPGRSAKMDRLINF